MASRTGTSKTKFTREHNHDGNSFRPWHRELLNRYEALLQQSDPDVALHYWDWTEEPRAASDGPG